MVRAIRKNKINYHQCEECEFVYKDRTLAKKCEEWCKKHHSCNMEITTYSIKIE